MRIYNRRLSSFFLVNLLSVNTRKICHPFAAFFVQIITCINFRSKPKLKLLPKIPSDTERNVNRRSKYSFFFYILIRFSCRYVHGNTHCYVPVKLADSEVEQVYRIGLGWRSLFHPTNGTKAESTGHVL